MANNLREGIQAWNSFCNTDGVCEFNQSPKKESVQRILKIHCDLWVTCEISWVQYRKGAPNGNWYKKLWPMQRKPDVLLRWAVLARSRDNLLIQNPVTWPPKPEHERREWRPVCVNAIKQWPRCKYSRHGILAQLIWVKRARQNLSLRPYGVDWSM